MNEPENVGTKVRAGLRWTAIGLVSTRMSRFLANIVLARLLAVEVFGIIAMAHAAMLLMGALREAGLGQAYIQRATLDDERPTEAIDTLFSAMLVLNGLLFAVMLALAPAVADFFRDDSAAVLPVLRALAVIFLLDSFVATPQFVLQRRMAFDRIALSELTGGLAQAGVAIGAAFAGAGVWALVMGMIAERLVMATTLALGAGWRPGFRGSKRVAVGLLNFGKYLWGYAMVRAMGSVMDRVVVGRVHGSGGLGGYSQAFNICILPATVIAQLVNRVALPAMSRMQDDIPRLRAAFLKSFEHVSFLALPIGFGLYAVSDVFVPVVYGDKWRGIVPIVEVLCAYGTVMAVASVCGPVLQALGRPNIFFHTELLRQGLLLALLFFFARHGEVAVAWSILGALGVVSVVALGLISKLLQLGGLDLLVPLTRSLLPSAGMAFAVYGVRSALAPSIGETAELVLAVAIGIVAYPVLSAVTNASMVRGFLQTIREVRVSRTSTS